MYRVFRKNCVFSQFTASPPSQRNASVQQLLLDGDFLYNQQQPSAGEGEVANSKEFLEKSQYLVDTLYLIKCTYYEYTLYVHK